MELTASLEHAHSCESMAPKLGYQSHVTRWMSFANSVVQETNSLQLRIMQKRRHAPQTARKERNDGECAQSKPAVKRKSEQRF